MAYKKYTVKQGDCISSIAFKFGYFPDTIWNDRKNSELKKKREDPNVLLPGDVVRIRDKEEKEESCATKQLHRFRRKGVPEKLVIQFKREGEPRAKEEYILEIDGVLFDGKTDPEEMIKHFIPPNAKKAKITFRKTGEEHKLDLGNLDPITEISGVQQRLQNLGFFSGPVDGEMNEPLEQAIREFQESNEKEPTGKLDDTTRNMIQEASES